jgi:hypothetical protein
MLAMQAKLPYYIFAKVSGKSTVFSAQQAPV